MAEVVVGVDGSPAGQDALRLGWQEAALGGHTLRVVHTWSSVPYLVAPGLGVEALTLVDTEGKYAHAVLENALADVRASGVPADVEVIEDLRPGDAATVLSELSAGAAMLVVGARRHGALARLVIGSATNGILHHAHCPVIVVPKRESPAGPWAKVVVGTDGSPSGRAAVQWAAARAEAHRCPLVVLHAWQLPLELEWPTSPSVPSQDTYDEQSRVWLADEVASCLPTPPTVPVELRVVAGYASAVLLEAAGPDDLLVVGSRGHRALAGLLLGSTAMQVAHHAHGTVAVLRTP